MIRQGVTSGGAHEQCEIGVPGGCRFLERGRRTEPIKGGELGLVLFPEFTPPRL